MMLCVCSMSAKRYKSQNYDRRSGAAAFGRASLVVLAAVGLFLLLSGLAGKTNFDRIIIECGLIVPFVVFAVWSRRLPR